jgi:hypothetical protein
MGILWSQVGFRAAVAILRVRPQQQRHGVVSQVYAYGALLAGEYYVALYEIRKQGRVYACACRLDPAQFLPVCEHALGQPSENDFDVWHGLQYLALRRELDELDLR